MGKTMLQRAKKRLAIYRNSGYRNVEPGSYNPDFFQKIYFGALEFINGAKGLAMQILCVVVRIVFFKQEKLLPSFSKLFLPTNTEKCYRS